MEGEKELTTVRLTNNVFVKGVGYEQFLGYIAPGIQELSKKINDPTLTYETLYSYFVYSIQGGRDITEFWIVWDEEKIYGYAHWYVKPPPYRGSVICDFIHCCRNRKNVTQMLVDEFIKFGKKQRCKYYEGSAVSEPTFKVFRKRALKMGYEINKTGKIHFLGSRR